MKPTQLSQAIFFGLTTIALTACGSSDDDINTINTTPVINPTPTLTPTTPTTTTPTTNTASLANILENAKIAGLNDANAALFAEKVKNLSFGSPEYNEALIKARQEQTDAINKALAEQAKAVSPIVDTNNPFIDNVDIREVATVSSNHYVRQQGSTYDLTANPTGIAGLGGVAIDDPTTSNPWLSNYVLGTEVVRDGTGKPTVIAIDSAGEMAEFNSTGAIARVSGTNSPYFINDGTYYKTQRGNGGEGLYNHRLGTVTPATPNGTGTSGILTLQDQMSTHAVLVRESDITQALTTAKDQNDMTPSQNPNGGIQNQGRNPRTGATTTGRTNTFRTGLLAYSSNSVPVGNEIGKKLGYKVPMWGKEENVYHINPETDKLEVINSVDITELEKLTNAQTPLNRSGSSAGNGWYTSRYGTFESVNNQNLNEDGTVPIADQNNFNGKKVANNDSIRIFGKNFRSTSANAQGQQIIDNTYTAKYNTNGVMNSIQTARLQHVQYGRLTNNIDVLAESEVGKKGANGNDRIVYRRFQPHGAPNSVDTYFYRGTNHTTIDQMKALGGVIQYHGHALTYNLGPYAVANAKEQVGLPTAYGNNAGSGNTIGNFVQAKFDVAKATLEGSIYNFINEKRSDKDEDFKKQDLATFKGNVYGNTVVGTAEKVGVEGTGSLTASFFGPNATEIGGNISSVSRAEGYGDAKWGAVFGATRGSAIEQFNVIETNNVNP